MRKRCKTKQDHIDFCRDVHGDTYDYSEWIADTTPFNNKTKIPIVCRDHGVFYQILNNHKCGAGCPACYGNDRKTREQYIQTFVERWGKRYTYEEWTVDKFTAHTKIPITCPQHGVFEQSINGHIRGHGCPQCKLNKMQDTCLERHGVSNINKKNFSEYTASKLEDREWLYEQHIVRERTISDIAAELKVSATPTVTSRLVKFDIPITYHQNVIGRSTAEKELCDFLTNNLKLEIETSNRTLIKPKELDIVVSSHKVAIEYCGLYWHSTANARMTPSYHKQKTDACNDIGYRLITIFEDEWLHSRELVEGKLRSLFQLDDRKRVPARKCKVVQLDHKSKRDFFNAHHIQGTGPGSITYGLYCKEELVAAMTFINQNRQWILNRYATMCNVQGGFSKLLKHFCRNHEWTEIVSFADRRWSEGAVYEVNGFELDGMIPPDYYYVVGNRRVHKFRFRHKNLSKIIGDDYDPNLSETENTAKAGYHRIYNCGLFRYVIKNPA